MSRRSGKRAALGQALRQFFDQYDVLLSPTMPIPAAYADPREDGLPNPNNYPSWMPYHLAVQSDQEPVLPRSRAASPTGCRSG